MHAVGTSSVSRHYPWLPLATCGQNYVAKSSLGQLKSYAGDCFLSSSPSRPSTLICCPNNPHSSGKKSFPTDSWVHSPTSAFVWSGDKAPGSQSTSTSKLKVAGLGWDKVRAWFYLAKLEELFSNKMALCHPFIRRSEPTVFYTWADFRTAWCPHILGHRCKVLEYFQQV